ncbi:MAG: glycogen/starch/alpha-glucan family phosphorylase [Clostridia bacterium]|nr:glycogen/starch/alpha-glucan family phosphorylase [Clostridia bacterium]
MIDAHLLAKRAETILLARCHKEPAEAGAAELHEALSLAAMEQLTPLWIKKEKARSASRQAYYLSAEYLMGRMVFNNLYCLGILDDVRREMAQRGVDLTLLEDVEDDAFGNGGLGRLAACFLDSAVTHDIPLTGYGLRYRYGLFRQSIVDGKQHEEPDDWAKYGDPWSVRREDCAVVVPMKSGDVKAVPYDMPVIGYGAENIGTLRLWQCESLHEIDFPLFNAQQYARASADKNRAEDITKFLYPNDTRRGGKLLRVKQQYVLVSASLQDLLRRYKAQHGKDFSAFAALHAVQLNDTHPVMAIPELIRLLEAEGLTFEEAFGIAGRVFSYTNHTVMQEALEKWDLSLLRAVSPELVDVIRRIDARFRAENAAASIGPDYCIIEGRRVHMAQLAVYVCHTTNGVARIHSELLKSAVFSRWYARYPERFQNKTNGITQRRWLGLCNPELCALLSDALGSDAYLTELDRLRGLDALLDSPAADALVRRFTAVKQEKKQQLSDLVQRQCGISIDPDWLFDVQVKRLHEYKRQFMNALSLIALYDRLKAGKLPGWRPTVFLFGAKAAPGYDRAKAVIYLINQIAGLVNSDPETRDLLRVVFIPNYNCSWAEKIIPAADISEQISPAGTEASGTGNMKLMLNGAVTLGTFDGANIEIVEQAGRENNYIFGGTVEELDAVRRTYKPRALYEKDAEIRRTLDRLTDGTFKDPDGSLAELKASLLDGASWHAPDHYFVLYDFHAYMDARIRANRESGDRHAFALKALRNIAGAGKFSSDRTIAEYASEIWGL